MKNATLTHHHQQIIVAEAERRQIAHEPAIQADSTSGSDNESEEEFREPSITKCLCSIYIIKLHATSNAFLSDNVQACLNMLQRSLRQERSKARRQFTLHDVMHGSQS